MAENKELEAMQKMAQEVIANEQVPNIYGNGFICINTNADIVIIFKRNDKPVSLINLSYSTAKTLSEKLGKIIRDFEKATGNSIMTINVIDDKLKVSKNVKLQ